MLTAIKRHHTVGLLYARSINRLTILIIAGLTAILVKCFDIDETALTPQI